MDKLMLACACALAGIISWTQFHWARALKPMHHEARKHTLDLAQIVLKSRMFQGLNPSLYLEDVEGGRITLSDLKMPVAEEHKHQYRVATPAHRSFDR